MPKNMKDKETNSKTKFKNSKLKEKVQRLIAISET
jgi:hypothetical protein